MIVARGENLVNLNKRLSTDLTSLAILISEQPLCPTVPTLAPHGQSRRSPDQRGHRESSRHRWRWLARSSPATDNHCRRRYGDGGIPSPAARDNRRRPP